MKPKEYPDNGGLASLRLLTALAICLGAPFLLMGATGPAWWYNGSLTTTGMPLVSGTANDFAAINQGQAKNVAVTAINELNTDLAQFGGAGDTLNQLALTLTATSAQTNDYAALSIGQLKFLAQPFYDRLISLSCTVPPIVSGTYPWVTSGLTANDYAMANIGQTKQLFSFDVTASSASNGIPDWWVNEYFPGSTFGGVTGVDPNGYVSWSGSQVSNLTAYQNGWNPLDFYNGQKTLLMFRGDGQTGSVNAFLPGPLIVWVTDTNGNPMYGAPVTFTVTSGGGFLQASATSASASSLTILADSSGCAEVFFQSPGTPYAINLITVTVGGAGTTRQVAFQEATDGPTAIDPSAFAPANVIGITNADGSETITWQNSSYAPQFPTYVYLQSGDSWSVLATLAPGVTSYTATGGAVGRVEIGNAYTPGGSTGNSGSSDPGFRPFAPIPIQSYATIWLDPNDVRNGSGAGTSIVVDDQNNAVFGFSDTSGTCYDTFTWQNGYLSQPRYFPQRTGEATLSGTITHETVALAPGGVFTNGGVWSQEFTVETGTAPGDDSNSSAYTLWQVSPADLPNPPFLNSLGQSNGLGVWALEASGGGTVAGRFSENCTSGNDEVLVSGQFIMSGSGWSIFSTNAPFVSGVTVSNQYFLPGAVNDQGCAIGTGTDGVDFWDGKELIQVVDASDVALGNPPPSILNNQNMAIVSIGEDPENSYLCLVNLNDGTDPIPLQSLVPPQFQDEILICDVFSISNVDSNNNILILCTGFTSYSAPPWVILTVDADDPTISSMVVLGGDDTTGAINANGLISSGNGPLISFPATLTQVTYSGAARHDVWDDSTIKAYQDPDTPGKYIYVAQKFSSKHGPNQWQAPDPTASGTAAQQQGWQDPICYTSGATMSAAVQIKIPAGILPPSATIQISGSGVGDWGQPYNSSGGYNFPATTATLDSSGTVITSGPITCTQAFPSYTVGYIDPLTINWQISLDGGNTWSSLGNSTNECFVTLQDPAINPTNDGNYRLYRTVLYYACGTPGATSEPQAEANTWSMFTSDDNEPANICAWDSANKSYDRKLRYYGAPRGFGGLQPVSTTAILSGTDGDGECYAFGQLFQDALWANNIDSNGTKVTAADGDYLLIKDLTPSNVGSLPTRAPYSWEMIFSSSKAEMAPLQWSYGDFSNRLTHYGQNTRPPVEKVFNNHYIVQYRNLYFDPSYGVTYSGQAFLGVPIGAEFDFAAKAVQGYGEGIPGDDVNLAVDLSINFPNIDFNSFNQGHQ